MYCAFQPHEGASVSSRIEQCVKPDSPETSPLAHGDLKGSELCGTTSLYILCSYLTKINSKPGSNLGKMLMFETHCVILV